MNNKNIDKYSNKEIAFLLRSIAAAYMLKNENRFKIIAYEKAADTIDHLSREVIDLWQENKLNEIPGVGKSIGDNLDEYFRTGESKHFNNILNLIPRSVYKLIKVPGIGPKTAYKLVTTLKLNNENTVIEDLKLASQNNMVSLIPNFGKQSQIEILSFINSYQNKLGKYERAPLLKAYSIANEIINYLNQSSFIEKVDVLGSLRRMVSTIGDIDISVKLKKEYSNVINYFIKYPKVIKIIEAGEKKASILVRSNIKIDLRVQKEDDYGTMLQYFTGNKTHNIKLREYANKKGYSLSEYGVTKIEHEKLKTKNKKKEKLIKFKTEEELYNFFGFQYIPPELREGTNELELAKSNKIPNLVELKDIKGDLHIHSSYDLQPSHNLGEDSYEEIIIKSNEFGYEYIGFTDHNPKISDLSEDEIITILKIRKQYIDQILSSNKVERSYYFIGLEVDIRPDGTLALPIKAIEYLDYIIISIHSTFSMDINSMTNRLLKALSYPKIKILGHPAGRKINFREGIEIDWEKIFEFCKKRNIALEINSCPDRLDLPDTLVRQAINNENRLIINTDSHSKEQMNNMNFGVSVARRGWATKNDIMNCLSYNEFKDWILRG